MLIYISIYLIIGGMIMYGLSAFLALTEEKWYGLPSAKSYSISDFVHDIAKFTWNITYIIQAILMLIGWPVILIIFPFRYRQQCKEQKKLKDIKDSIGS